MKKNLLYTNIMKKVNRVVTESLNDSDETLDNVMEFFMSKLDKEYDLCYTDYDDTLDDYAEEINKCIEDNEVYPLTEKEYDWFGESIRYHAQTIFDEIYDNIVNEFGEEVADDFKDKYEEDCIIEIEDRNVSDPIGECLGRTRMLGRVIVGDSVYLNVNDEIDFDDEDLIKIFTFLGLNPKDVADYIAANYDVECVGNVPNIPSNTPIVKLDEFVDDCMMQYTDGYMSLTFLGWLPLVDMWKVGFNFKSITIPKGTIVLLYDSNNGGGGIEVETIAPKSVEMNDNVSICTDECGNGYSVDGTYGFNTSIFSELFSINQELKESALTRLNESEQTTINVGDILYAYYHYDYSQDDHFYYVISRTATSVKCIELDKVCVEKGGIARPATYIPSLKGMNDKKGKSYRVKTDNRGNEYISPLGSAWYYSKSTIYHGKVDESRTFKFKKSLNERKK